MANSMQRREQDLQNREQQMMTQMQYMMSCMLSQNSCNNNHNKKTETITTTTVNKPAAAGIPRLLMDAIQLCNPSTRQYCWTHGACAHIGTECMSPDTGHQAQATFANVMNG